ncbi:hypothetical protein lerEdw1_003935, partial [Lerista edwardsae]
MECALFLQGQGFLIQIFADRSRPLPVRIIACKGLLESNPTLPLVMSIVNVLLRDNNMQLRSFAYCHMKTMANIGLPHLFGVSSACNVAIKLLSSKLNTLDKLSLRYSKIFQFSKFNNQYRVGMLGKLSWISSPQTVFPTDIISSLELFVGGARFQPVEVALRMQGLSELLWKQGQQFDQYDTHQKTKETERE